MRFWNALNGKAWLNNATKFGHGDLLCDLCDGAVEVIIKIILPTQEIFFIN